MSDARDACRRMDRVHSWVCLSAIFSTQFGLGRLLDAVKHNARSSTTQGSPHTSTHCVLSVTLTHGHCFQLFFTFAFVHGRSPSWLCLSRKLRWRRGRTLTTVGAGGLAAVPRHHVGARLLEGVTTAIAAAPPGATVEAPLAAVGTRTPPSHLPCLHVSVPLSVHKKRLPQRQLVAHWDALFVDGHSVSITHVCISQQNNATSAHIRPSRFQKVALRAIAGSPWIWDLKLAHASDLDATPALLERAATNTYTCPNLCVVTSICCICPGLLPPVCATCPALATSLQTAKQRTPQPSIHPAVASPLHPHTGRVQALSSPQVVPRPHDNVMLQAPPLPASLRLPFSISLTHPHQGHACAALAQPCT
jgi:hypothetical protein